MNITIGGKQMAGKLLIILWISLPYVHVLYFVILKAVPC